MFDHFMSFCIVEGTVKRTKGTPKYIEAEKNILLTIINYKTAIGRTDLLSLFDFNLSAELKL